MTLKFTTKQPHAKTPPSAVKEDGEYLVERDSVRKKTLLTGRIFIRDNQSTVDCIVRNRSDTGALLIISEDFILEMPRIIVLQIPEGEQRGRVVECEVRWQDNTKIGVKFLDEVLQEENDPFTV